MEDVEINKNNKLQKFFIPTKTCCISQPAQYYVIRIYISTITIEWPMLHLPAIFISPVFVISLSD